MLYDFIDNSNGFYRTFVTNEKYRSRMQVVFTVRSGSGEDHALVERFLQETNDSLGWMDIRSHPLGLPSDAIRVTMYNHQTMEAVQVVRDFMHDFQKQHDSWAFTTSALAKERAEGCDFLFRRDAREAIATCESYH